MKIMAKLDIAEKRLPQDGRIKIKMKIEDRCEEMDFRVSVPADPSARRSCCGCWTRTT